MNRFVIAEPKLCIGCYTCMPACVIVHQAAGLQAHPRLVVTQTPHGTMPVQCRQCDDAPCAKVCPVGAITQTEDAIQINESTCIGCKMCALACPFGAIEPHASSTLSQQMPFDAYIAASGVAPHDPMEATAKSMAPLSPLLGWTAGERTVAVKCDLCHFREGGPVCVEICPTKALRIVDEQAMVAANDAKRRQMVADTAAASPASPESA
jgi:hydrogenase-4 component A